MVLRTGTSWGYRFWYRKELQKKQGYATKKVAAAAEWTRRGELGARGHRGQAMAAPSPPLADWAATWLEQIREHVAPNTVIKYQGNLTKHILPRLGAIPVSELTRGQVRAAIDAAPLNRGTRRILRAIFSACLEDAVADQLIAVNPLQQLGRRRRRHGGSEGPAGGIQREPMQRAERDRFLAAFEARRPQGRFLAYMWLLANTGCRPSEGLGLRLEDLDWDAGTARLARQYVRGHIRPLKTYMARTIDVGRGALAYLRAHVDRLSEGQRRAGWVFPGYDGPTEGSSAGKQFRRTIRRLGWEGRFRLYDLRHTYASLQLSRGAPITYVSKQLGHQTPEITFRHYARWVPDGSSRRWVEDDGPRIVPLVDRGQSDRPDVTPDNMGPISASG